MIITMPHGGDQEPEEIENRTPGCVDPDTGGCLYIKDRSCASFSACPSTGETDDLTIDLGRIITDEIANLMGGRRPHVVISHLKR